jgi:hypothetical protein
MQSDFSWPEQLKIQMCKYLDPDLAGRLMEEMKTRRRNETRVDNVMLQGSFYLAKILTTLDCDQEICQRILEEIAQELAMVGGAEC